MLRQMIDQENVSSLEEMMNLAMESGVQFYICRMSMDLMGIKEEELIPVPGLEYCGVAGFLKSSRDAQQTLFI